MIKSLNFGKGKTPVELAAEYNSLSVEDKIIHTSDFCKANLNKSEAQTISLAENNSNSIGKKYLTADKNGFTAISPSNGEILRFKDANQHSSKITNSIDNVELTKMMLETSLEEILPEYNKITNSVFDSPVGARDLIVRTLAQPRKVAYGKYTDPISDSSKEITLDMFVEENPAHREARIDFGHGKITVADMTQLNAKFNIRSAISANIDSIDNINNFIASSNTESANNLKQLSIQCISEALSNILI